MKRAGQPFELAPVYIYLASDDSSFVTGQVPHVNGGIMTETRIATRQNKVTLEVAFCFFSPEIIQPHIEI